MVTNCIENGKVSVSVCMYVWDDRYITSLNMSNQICYFSCYHFVYHFVFYPLSLRLNVRSTGPRIILHAAMMICSLP